MEWEARLVPKSIMECYQELASFDLVSCPQPVFSLYYEIVSLFYAAFLSLALLVYNSCYGILFQKGFHESFRIIHGGVLRQVFFSLSRCFCSNCSTDLTTKAEECQCCQEIDRCGEVMEQFGDRQSAVKSLRQILITCVCCHIEHASKVFRITKDT